jgi:hypothetical protein
VREITLENDPWATIPTPPLGSWTADHQMADEADTVDERTGTAEEPETAEAAAEPALEETTAPLPEPAPDSWMAAPENGEPKTGTDPVAVEAAAAGYLATRDPRAAAMALEAARYYIQEGDVDAASDLLLQLIAAGVANHDAQRLLIDVVRTLGKREVAKTKCQLLAHALLLDGRNDLAAEVEALALSD